MSAALLIFLAWAIEWMIGWPDWLYKRIRHPVVWFGWLISALDRGLNRMTMKRRVRYFAGVLSALICVAAATGFASCITAALPSTVWGFAVEAIIASSFIASRSLRLHVEDVARPLLMGNIEAARAAVAMIVGRDPAQLDETGIARASLESLAENTSDGVTAPLFWGALLGLPGIAAYKMINTLDSMIGYRNERYSAFGGFAARLDDVANIIPSRLTGLLIAMASVNGSAFTTLFRDAQKHRSPNAGWPEAAMAGALGIRLSGPRVYGAEVEQTPWLNAGARDPKPDDIKKGLAVYRNAMILAAIGLAMLSLGAAL